jgi:hypothetical protein
MDKNEHKMRIKEQIIEENYYLTRAMMAEDTNKILRQKDKINKLVKEYLELLELPI